MIARSPTVNGPFEPCPDNPILTHRGTNHPIQNTGHGDLVQAPDGSCWMVLLGVRPRGGTPGWHVLDRETFLAPVRWVDGWPVVGELVPGAGLPPGAEPVRDDFDESDLHPRWTSLRHRPADRCTTGARPGRLTLRADGGSPDDPDVTLVGRRQQHLSCRARVAIDPADGSGGLVVRLDERHHYAVEVADGQVSAYARIGPLRSLVGSAPAGPGEVVPDISITEDRTPTDSHAGPDAVTLGVVRPDGTRTELACLDGRYLSTEVAGGFTGRVIGMYASSGAVHFDWFDYEPVEEPVEATDRGH